MFGWIHGDRPPDGAEQTRMYNPRGATWGNGNLSWGHSVSADLVSWTALDPDSPFDANGCWSGSATTLPDGRPAMLYTGIDAAGNQVQNVAFPKNASDPLLREWVKPHYNPVIPLPKDVAHDSFRDPSTAWRGRDGLWRVAVAAKVNVSVGSTLIYRSKDFLRWVRNAAPLYESSAAGMVECPDLFPVADPGDQNGLDYAPSNGAAWHVLKLSVMATLQDYYVVGRYDDSADTFAPAAGSDNDSRTWRRLDYGHVCASKSFDARKNRRVLWGWANESDAEADYVARGWSGLRRPDGPEEGLAGQGREAAAAVADRGDRDAEEKACRVARSEGELRRREQDHRRRGLAGGRGGRLRDPGPGGGREPRAQWAVGPAEAVRREGRIGARRGRPVRAARLGLRRPARAHLRLLQGVQA